MDDLTIQRGNSCDQQRTIHDGCSAEAPRCLALPGNEWLNVEEPVLKALLGLARRFAILMP
jgi:hypothetical protein